MSLKNYSIVVNDYSGTDKENAVQALIDICGYIRSDAVEIIEDLPQEILVELDGETAEKFAQALDAEGLDTEVYNEDNSPVEYESKRSEGSGFWKALGIAAGIALLTRRHRRPPYYTRTLFGGWRRPKRRRPMVEPMPPRPRGFGARVTRRPANPAGPARKPAPGPGAGERRPAGSMNNRPAGGMSSRPQTRTNSRPAGGAGSRPSGSRPSGNRGGMSGGPRGGMGGNRGGRGPGR